MSEDSETVIADKKVRKVIKWLTPIITVWVLIPAPLRPFILTGMGVSGGGFIGSLISGHGGKISKVEVKLDAIEKKQDSLMALVLKTQRGVGAIKLVISEMKDGEPALKRIIKKKKEKQVFDPWENIEGSNLELNKMVTVTQQKE